MTTTDNGATGAEVIPLHAVEVPTGAEVDQAVPAGPAVYADTTPPGTRRPIIPEPLHRQNLKTTVRQAAGLCWHRARYHGIRLHWYLVLTCAYAVRGAGVLTGRLLAWWHWVDGKALESQAVAAGRAGHGDAMRVHVEGKKTRSARGQIVAVCAIVALVVLLAGIRAGLPLPAWCAAGAVLVLALARVGRPAGQPMIRAAVVPARYETPTPAVIERALKSLGIPQIRDALKDDGHLAFVSDVHRDGPGWGVQLDLPYGVTPDMVMAKRKELASGLRRPLSAVWPAGVPDTHEGRLELWIGFGDPAKARPVAWPLAARGRADLFREVPFAADLRGRPVSVLLMFASVLIGAMPRMGKTFALRILMLAAALDPIARLRVWELKGTGDLAAAEAVAHEYGSGADEDTLERCLRSLRSLRAQLDTRAKTLRELPDHMRPENKVTPELARDRKLGLYPEVFIIDECQEAFSDSQRKAEFEQLALPIVKRGPALGIMLILATQRPDANSLPTGIAANIGIRFCLKVMGWRENNMILGDGMSAAGFNATEFALSDKGIGWLAGHGDAPQVVRGFYIDDPASKVIAARARQARQAAGTLSGHALGEAASDGPARDFLADVLAVFGTDPNLYSPTIAARLADRIPAAYTGITADAVASQLRAARVRVKDVRESGGPPRKGAARADVEAAVQAALDAQPAGEVPADV